MRLLSIYLEIGETEEDSVFVEVPVPVPEQDIGARIIKMLSLSYNEKIKKISNKKIKEKTN